MIAITFTGHRPQKLGGYDFNSIQNRKIRNVLGNMLYKDLICLDDIHFITGGAIGFDQMAFHVCDILSSMLKNKKIKLELAIPFELQYKLWRDDDKKRHFDNIRRADVVTYVDTLDSYDNDAIDVGVGIYHPLKMQFRNMYMVDKADKVYACWDLSAGGTRNCVNYAKSNNKEIMIINPKSIMENL